MDSGAVFAHAPGIVSRQIDGEVLLVNLQRGTLQVLNEVGAWLWEHMDGQRTVTDLAQALSAEYDVGLEQACTDVRIFCEDLLQRECVDRCRAPA